MSSAGLRSRVRGALSIFVGGAILAGALGVPYKRLQETRADHHQLVDARLRLEKLRRECAEFESQGGFSKLAELKHETSGCLPRELSRIDLHGALTLLAQVSGMELKTLSVGELSATDFAQLDDAVGRCEVSLSARGGLQALSNLVELLRQLGYPTAVLDFRLKLVEAEGSRFDIHATLGLFESMPIPATELSDVPQMEFPQ